MLQCRSVGGRTPTAVPSVANRCPKISAVIGGCRGLKQRVIHSSAQCKRASSLIVCGLNNSSGPSSGTS